MTASTETVRLPPPAPARPYGATLRRVALGTLFYLAVVVALGFFIIPIVAIFVHVSPRDLIHEMGNPVVKDALIVTLKTNLLAQALIISFGTPTAYFLASRQFRLRPLLITLVELPIVLPPAVAGLGLIVTFSRVGLFGERWSWLASQVAFTQLAVTFAIIFVAAPFYVRQGIAAFEAVDGNLIAASRTLGAGPLRTFFKVTLRLASGGLAAGFAICVARGLGEFGATAMFAGALQGRTETMPVAVYNVYEAGGGLEIPLAISALLVIFSVAILLSIKLIGLWRSSPQTSLSPFARSTSR